jgi:2Fe-2S ferredoxin
MAKITYHTHDSKTHTIDVQNGLTVMEGAVQNDIPGIDADCGGGMACATCHVYVKEDWLINFQLKKMARKICWIWHMSQNKIVD